MEHEKKGNIVPNTPARGYDLKLLHIVFFNKFAVNTPARGYDLKLNFASGRCIIIFKNTPARGYDLKHHRLPAGLHGGIGNTPARGYDLKPLVAYTVGRPYKEYPRKGV